MTVTAADKILKEVYRKYATCKSFCCKASLRRTIKASTNLTTHFEMNLSFVRPKQLYLEWWNHHRPALRHITLSSGKHTIVHTTSNSDWRIERSMEMAIAGEAGISMGLALDIPGLLAVKRRFLFKKLSRVQSNINDQDGFICIFGTRGRSWKRTIKLRAADYIIVGISDKYIIPNGVVECESEYTDIEMT
jgi:hypothetical protein